MQKEKRRKSDGNAEFNYLWERSDGGRSARYACGARRERGDVLESGKCMNDRSVAPWRRLYRRLQQHHRRPPARSLRAPFSARSCHRLQTDPDNQLGLISNSSQEVFWATFFFISQAHFSGALIGTAFILKSQLFLYTSPARAETHIRE